MECDRLVRVDGLQLSNCLFAYGQAWVKLERGDKDGADAAMRQARGMVPPETVDLITSMITRGELPVPGPDGKWTDQCRDAREGRLTLSLLVCSDQAAHERAVAADPAPRLRATPVPAPSAAPGRVRSRLPQAAVPDPRRGRGQARPTRSARPRPTSCVPWA